MHLGKSVSIRCFRWILVCSFLAIAFNIVKNDLQVMAFTKYEGINTEQNKSIEYAFNNCTSSSSEARGMMWLSDTGDTGSARNKIVATTLGNQTVYIHGAVICAEDRTGRLGNFIKFVHTSSTIRGVAIDGYSGYSPLSISACSASILESAYNFMRSAYPASHEYNIYGYPWGCMDRTSYIYSDVSSDSTNYSANTQAAVLNIEGVSQAGNYDTSERKQDATGAWNTVYYTTLQAYRCYQNRYPDDTTDGINYGTGCYSEPSYLEVWIPDTLLSASGKFTSRSSVRLDVQDASGASVLTGGQWQGEMTADDGDYSYNKERATDDGIVELSSGEEGVIEFTQQIKMTLDSLSINDIKNGQAGVTLDENNDPRTGFDIVFSAKNLDTGASISADDIISAKDESLAGEASAGSGGWGWSGIAKLSETSGMVWDNANSWATEGMNAYYRREKAAYYRIKANDLPVNQTVEICEGIIPHSRTTFSLTPDSSIPTKYSVVYDSSTEDSKACIKFKHTEENSTARWYGASTVTYVDVTGASKTSTASFDGESNWNTEYNSGNPIEIPISDTEIQLTFTHYIALDNPNVLLEDDKDYKIKNLPLRFTNVTATSDGIGYDLSRESSEHSGTSKLKGILRTLFWYRQNFEGVNDCGIDVFDACSSSEVETIYGSSARVNDDNEFQVDLSDYSDGYETISGKSAIVASVDVLKVTIPNDREEFKWCEHMAYAAKTFNMKFESGNNMLEFDSDGDKASACISFKRSGYEGKIMSTSSVEYESTVTSDFDSRVDYNGGTVIELESTDPEPIVTFEQRIWVEMPVTMDKLPDGAHIPYEIFASSTTAANMPQTGPGDAGMDSEADGGSTADSWTLYSSSDGNYLYYQTVLTDPVMLTVAEGQTVTVCQGTRHQYSAFTIGYGAGGAIASVSLQEPQRESQACIKFTRKRPSTSIPQFNCESTNIYAGRTTSISGVRNLSSGSPLKYKTNRGTSGTYSGWATTGNSPNEDGGYGNPFIVSIYARPGDTIQFTHELCFNAQAVRDSTRWTSGRPTNKFAKPKNWFSVTAKKWQNGTDGANSNYLFGKDAANDAVQITNGNRVHLDINEPYPRAINSDIRAVTRTFAYGFQLFSPDVDAGSMYNVGTAYTSNPFPSENVGYRIPSRDTGSVISQEFKANQVKSWIIYKSHQYGSCNGECPSSGTSDGARNRESGYHSVWTNPNSGPFSSYEAATGTGGTWGFRNNAHYYCYTVCCRWRWCCCSYSCSGSGESRSCTCSHYGYCCCAARRWTLSNSATYASKSNDGSGYSGTGAGGGTDRSNGVGDYTPVTDTEGDGLPQFTKTAEVIIPYNYTTSVDISIDHDGGVVYLGESVNVNSYKVDLNPRENNTVSTSAYATVSHPATHVQIIEFLVNPDVSLGSQTAGDSSNASDPCSFFISRFGSSSGVRETCAARIYNEDTTINPSGSYTGGTFSGGGISRIIPDTVEVGTKYCVAIGVYPSGSHLLASDGYSSRGDSEYSAADPGLRNTYTWNISGASCRTIAKKPNMQVWGGNIYAGGGGVSTSQSTPIVGANWSGSNRTIFGSWDEYGILGGSSSGIASGAALGYSSSINPIGGASSGSNLNPMTISSVSSPTSLLLARLKSRYQIGTGYPTMLGGLCGKIRVTAGSITCGQLENGATYIHSSGNVTIRANSGSAIAIDHNEISETVTSTNSAKSNKGTLILDIAGTLTITQNICYGSCSVYNSTTNGGKGVYYQTMNKLGVYGSDTYESIAEIPQVIIFAGNINITDNVTQLDAWLVSEGGKIDTCSSGISDANSCNKTLIINGPVFANSLALNRTAGALQGMNSARTLTGYNLPFVPMESDSSLLDPSAHNIANDGHITPAEIFNLRADTYLWAYSQASRYTEAQTTYTRELAPRY